MPHEVFISYRSEDKVHADRVCQTLEANAVRCWIAPRDIPVGGEWATAIVSALRDCKAFILVLSSHSQNAKQISREAELADNMGLPILTVRVEDVQPPAALLYFLGNVQWLDAFGTQEAAAYAKLPEVIRRMASPNTGEAVEPVRIPSPPAPAAPVSAPQPTSIPPLAGRKLPVPLIIGAVGLVLAVVVFFAARKPAPDPTSDAEAASAFGIEYMKQRDSGHVDEAYAMLGPNFQKTLSQQQFDSAVAALGHHKAAKYSADGACTQRERGAFNCDYHIEFSNGRTIAERLIAAKRDGTWQIAGDPLLR